jgi:enoyl-[acyl-carrier-protein] reductase (NADH)
MIPLTGTKGAKALQVAHLNHFLLSEKADHITGTEMYIDGGESLLGP